MSGPSDHTRSGSIQSTPSRARNTSARSTDSVPNYNKPTFRIVPVPSDIASHKGVYNPNMRMPVPRTGRTKAKAAQPTPAPIEEEPQREDTTRPDDNDVRAASEPTEDLDAEGEKDAEGEVVSDLEAEEIVEAAISGEADSEAQDHAPDAQSMVDKPSDEVLQPQSTVEDPSPPVTKTPTASPSAAKTPATPPVLTSPIALPSPSGPPAANRTTTPKLPPQPLSPSPSPAKRPRLEAPTPNTIVNRPPIIGGNALNFPSSTFRFVPLITILTLRRSLYIYPKQREQSKLPAPSQRFPHNILHAEQPARACTVRRDDIRFFLVLALLRVHVRELVWIQESASTAARRSIHTSSTC